MSRPEGSAAGGSAPMIWAVLSLLACQLGGEIISQGLGLPFPGPVLGMVFLAGFLIARGQLNREVEQVADFLLRHLGLFFVPAAVGVMSNGDRIVREFVPIGVALLVSTALTIGVTATVFRAVDRLITARQQQ